MAKAQGTKSGVGQGRGTGKGYGQGGLRTGPKNGTGPRSKSGACILRGKTKN
jgi:hypothetical protein